MLKLKSFLARFFAVFTVFFTCMTATISQSGATVTFAVDKSDSFLAFELAAKGEFKVYCGVTQQNPAMESSGCTTANGCSFSCSTGNCTITKSSVEPIKFRCNFSGSGSQTVYPSFKNNTQNPPSGYNSNKPVINFNIIYNDNDSSEILSVRKIKRIFSVTNGGFGGVFPTLSNADSGTSHQPSFENLFSGAANLSGNIPSDLFCSGSSNYGASDAIYGAPSRSMFMRSFNTVGGWNSSVSLPSGLFRCLSGPAAENVFKETFFAANVASENTGIGADFFGSLTTPAVSMFEGTFSKCSGSVVLPSSGDLFGTLNGAGASNMFRETFVGSCVSGTITNNFFGNITSYAANMFDFTFHGNGNVHGYISPNLFRGLTGSYYTSNSTGILNSMSYMFEGSGLAESCDSFGLVVYNSDNNLYQAAQNGNPSVWNGKKACDDRATVTVNAGNHVNSIYISGWAASDNTSRYKKMLIGETVNLSNAVSSFDTGYSGYGYDLSGSGSLSNGVYTAGATDATITINATTLSAPNVSLTASNSSQVYNYTLPVILSASTGTNYASGVEVYYSFGESDSQNGTYTYDATPITGPNNMVNKQIHSNAYLGTKYHKVKAYATDGTITSNSAESYSRTVTLDQKEISFDATTNGGTLSGTSAGYVGYNSENLYNGPTGTTPVNVPTATKTGYSFLGWYTSQNGGDQIYTANGNIVSATVSGWVEDSKWVTTTTRTLYAQFELNRHKITFLAGAWMANNVDGYVENGSANIYSASTGSAALTVPTFSVNNGTHTGWYTAGANGVQIYDNNGNLTSATVANYVNNGLWNLSSDQLLYPRVDCNAGYTFNGNNGQCEANTCTVTFKTGNTILGTQSFTNGDSLTTISSLSNNIPANLMNYWNGVNGFNGWSTGTDSSTEYTDGQSFNNLCTTNGGGITLYGVWQRNVPFKYYSGGNATSLTTNNRTQLYYNTSDTVASANSVSSYRLYDSINFDWRALGWATDNRATNVNAGLRQTASQTNINVSPSWNEEAPTYYAVYKRTPIIQYGENGGTGTTSDTDCSEQIFNVGYGVVVPSTCELANNNFTAPTGKSFSKWGTCNAGCVFLDAGSDYTFPNTYWGSSKNKKLYAQWLSNISVTANPKILIYNGSAQSCAPTTMTYTAPQNGAGTSVTYSTSQNGTYSENGAPNLTNADTSTIVWYKVIASGYADYIDSYECRMIKATMNPTASNNSKIYDESALTCNGNTWSNVPNGSTKYYSTDGGNTWSTTAPTRTAAGTTIVTWKVTNPNYNDKTGIFTCTVNKKSCGLILSETSGSSTFPNIKTFTASTNVACTLSVSPTTTGNGAGNGVNATASVPSGVNTGTVTATPVASGNQTITVTGVHPNDNYSDSTGTYVLTIDDGTIPEPVCSTDHLTYNGTTTSNGTAQYCPRLTSFLDGATETYSSTVNGTYSSSTPTITNVGNTTIYYKLNKANYTERSGSCTCTMDAATPEYTKTNKTKVYDGTPLTCNGVSFTGSGNKPTDGTITYSLSENGTYTTNVPQITNVGDHEIWFKVSGANFNESDADSFICSIGGASCTPSLSESSGSATCGSNNTTSFTINRGGCNGAVTVSSSDTSVATASLNGNNTVTVTRVGAGTATISVTVAATQEYTPTVLTLPYTFNGNRVPGSTTIKEGTTVVNSGTVQFPNSKTLNVTCAGGGTPTISNSGDTSVATATISNGTITMTSQRPGTSTITVSCPEVDCYEASTANYTLTVERGTCSIMLNPNSGTVRRPDTASFLVTSVSNGAISAVSSDSSVVESINIVNREVTVRPGAPGTATISVSIASTNEYNACEPAEYTLTVLCDETLRVKKDGAATVYLYDMNKRTDNTPNTDRTLNVKIHDGNSEKTCYMTLRPGASGPISGALNIIIGNATYSAIPSGTTDD